MKRTLALILAVVMVFGLAACGGSSSGSGSSAAPANSGTGQSSGGSSAAAPAASGDKPLAGTYDITVWCADKIVDLTKKQIEDFNASNEDGIKFNATVEPVGEGEAATQMITDVEAGGDIFCFAQDQFARLVQAGALSKLGVQAAQIVREANDAGVVAAATMGDELYDYPLTSDNGYFMYYDKSVIPEEDLGSLEKLIADCEAANKYFSMENETSAWYIASWFFGTGCVSEWETDSDGSFISVHDTFNSDKGLIAVKGMKKLLDSPMYLSSSDGAGFDSGCAIVVTGTWAYETVEGILGDNLGAADLPSFTVDGKEYHMGSFNGCKLMGVKPQTDAVKAAALHKLAQYLTGEAAQMERFNAVAWGPANLADQANEAVQANVAQAALFEQGPYSQPQGQIHGSWWDIAKVIGTDVKEATDEEGLKKALQNYYDAISALFTMTEEEKNAWGAIGAIGGTAWDTDFPMTEVSDGVFETEPIELHAGEEFKVRQGASWDVNYGADGTIGGPNVVVEADGTYVIRLTIDGDVGTIELIAQ